MNSAGGLVEEYNYYTFNKHDLSRGKLIGYIERLLVIILTFYSAYPAIAFIVTAKSIARFKQMDDRNWAEYFLLGTLTSMFLGIFFGLLLREVLI
jgi:diadenosine tetraphosphate (Ap4A) HIT family hydrolase